MLKGSTAFTTVCPRHNVRIIRPRLFSQHRSVTASLSIREFIATESPVKGFDGKYRERPREATIEAALIGLPDMGALISPGVETLMRVEQPVLEQVIADKGQVLLSVMSGPSATAAPPKGSGSYSVLAQAFGVQRMPGGSGGGFLRLRAQQRVLVQAIQPAGEGSSPTSARAQAAVLPDRWAYYVRGAAVEAAMQRAQLLPGASSMDTVDLRGEPVDVRAAVVGIQDVGSELLACMVETVDLLRKQQRRAQTQQQEGGEGGSSSGLDEALDEADRLLEWCLLGQKHQREQGDAANADGSNGSSGSGDVLSFVFLERLSYAPLAISSLATYAGLPPTDLQAQRAKAMEASDLGMRLEGASKAAQALLARLAARAALDGVA